MTAPGTPPVAQVAAPYVAPPHDVPPAQVAPPAGPGVQPPFPAPPTEGDRRRVWMGLAVGGLALVLCCVGGVVGIFALGYTTLQALDEQARGTVTQYLSAVRAEAYPEAYTLLCARAQRQETVEAFATRVAQEPKIAGFTVHDPELVEQVIVPVDLRLSRGGEQSVQFVLVQDSDTGSLGVCDIV